MKKTYEEPVISVQNLLVEDVITTSTGNWDQETPDRDFY